MILLSDEYQTPRKYMIAAREAMGSIDLDPACSIVNYKRISHYIENFYSEDGIEREWFGNVWLNPPYSKPNLTIWTQSLVDKISIGNVSQLIYLIPSYTSERWYHKCLHLSSAFCLPNHRINHLINGKYQVSPRFSSTFFYFGHNSIRFTEIFSQFGKCLLNK